MKAFSTDRKVGYARVSTDEQNLDMQLDALKKFGCGMVWEDHASAGAKKRKGLDSALLDTEEGDTFVVWKLDRLARRIRDILYFVDLFEDRGIHFVSLRDNIDTSTASGRMMLSMLGAMAEFERDQIAERTKAGMRAAKARGKKIGNARKFSAEMVKDAQHLRDTGWTVKKIAEHLKKRYRLKDLSEKSVYNYTRPKGSKKRPARRIMDD